MIRFNLVQFKLALFYGYSVGLCAARTAHSPTPEKYCADETFGTKASDHHAAISYIWLGRCLFASRQILYLVRCLACSGTFHQYNKIPLNYSVDDVVNAVVVLRWFIFGEMCMCVRF